MTADRMASTRWAHAPGLAEADLDGERVIWDPRSGSLARLDRLGSMIWECLDGATTVDELADDLAAVFQSSPDVVQPDVEHLVARLAELRLIAEESNDDGVP